MASMRLRRYLWLAVAFAAAAPAAAQDRVALVIGNANYVHAGALANPGNDARAIAGALREVGFEVTEGFDLGRAGMEDRIRIFLNRAAAAKIALLFYAGHGMQIDGRNFLVPVDARLETHNDVVFGTVDLDRVMSGLSDPARASIVVLDACRDNPLARSFAARTRSSAVGTGLAAYSTVGTGTLIAYSTAPGKVASDGPRGNSPFAEALAKHLRTPGLEVRQMLTRVRNDVAEATKEQQVPWDNSSLRGDVYLAARQDDSARADPRRIETRPVQPPVEAEPVDQGRQAIVPPPRGRWTEDAMRESFAVSGPGTIMTGQTVVVTARDGRKMTCIGGSIAQRLPRRCAWH
ncbi:caspase family protein [Pseudorhodoplanes sp.]|uniref:caspase family protein n=1 Tax=Pseudorhodoplanes sp. TaxID=1934341 RepID=UPI003D12C1D1